MSGFDLGKVCDKLGYQIFHKAEKFIKDMKSHDVIWGRKEKTEILSLHKKRETELLPEEKDIVDPVIRLVGIVQKEPTKQNIAALEKEVKELHDYYAPSCK